MAKFGHPNIVAPQSEANDVAAYVRDQIQIYVMFLNTLTHGPTCVDYDYDYGNN